MNKINERNAFATGQTRPLVLAKDRHVLKKKFFVVALPEVALFGQLWQLWQSPYSASSFAVSSFCKWNYDFSNHVATVITSRRNSLQEQNKMI